MKDKHTRMPRGFGFVTFSDPSVIDRVLEDEHVIDGRTVSIYDNVQSHELHLVYILTTFLFIKVEVKRTVPREEMSSKDGPKTRKIFVGGIPPSLTEGCPPYQILFSVHYGSKSYSSLYYVHKCQATIT
jgi:heterogeneous nuclear ribonucleoprotein A1/A3